MEDEAHWVLFDHKSSPAMNFPTSRVCRFSQLHDSCDIIGYTHARPDGVEHRLTYVHWASSRDSPVVAEGVLTR